MADSESAGYGLSELLNVMSRLRDPDSGCSWDLQQTYQTIAPSTIEEAYEVVDAVERGDYQHLREELGDLLFQVVFYSQLAAEEQRFSFDDVVSELAGKLIRRHPHVFPAGTLESRRPSGSVPDDQRIAQTWEAIKENERASKGAAGVLDDVPLALPAMTRAVKLQKRASRCGFDWTHVDGVIAQVNDELQELGEAIAQQDHGAIAEEMGDLLFAGVNLSRHLGLDPEAVLRAGNRKFERRFRYIERCLVEEGLTPDQAEVTLMEDLWQQAKQEGL